jgi:thiol:disulfide interchange protein
MVKVALAMLLVLWSSPVSEDGSNYEMAYARAEKEGKPLVILVGADWCAACKTMKIKTIENMKTSGELKNVVFTQIDMDQRPDLAQQLMQGNALPQIIVFSKGQDGWKKHSLTGIQSEGRVKELIRKASSDLPGIHRG